MDQVNNQEAVKPEELDVPAFLKRADKAVPVEGEVFVQTEDAVGGETPASVN